MGKKIEIKLAVLVVFFLITCVFVYGYNQSFEIKPKPSLAEHFEHIKGYASLGTIHMLDEHVDMLDVDDFVFANFRGAGGKANLYIGYYYSANKAYAAHSPLICYPSQGWKVDTRPINATLEVGPHKINYEEIVTSYGRERELVLYWYQSHLLTNTQIYRNKIDMGYNKLFHNDEQHAFVRVSVPFFQDDYETAKQSAIDFIHAFYPRFVDYIRADGVG